MNELNLDLTPEPPTSTANVIHARQRRALVSSIAGDRVRPGRGSGSVDAHGASRGGISLADTFHPTTQVVPTAVLRTPAGGAVASTPGDSSAPARGLLDDALVVPAGALVRGYVRCRALLLAGDVVGNVHCTAGPVVVRAGASLNGRLVACGDVYVRGTVADSSGGAVISTRGKLTLAPGARVEGDVRSGRLDIHDGAMLAGVARAAED